MPDTPQFSTTPVNPATPPAMPPATPPSQVAAILHNRKVLRWLIFVAVGLMVASVLIFFFGSNSFSESGVSFTLSGPNQASVGDQIDYKVDFTNSTKTTLNNLVLTFTYPEGAVILDDNGNVMQNPSNVDVVKQDSLAPGQKSEQQFHVFLVGDKGNIKTAKAVLDFNAGSLQSPFEKEADVATTITDMPVNLTLSVPPNAVSGDSVTYVLDYRNQSSDQISGLQATFAYPDGFTPKQFSPSPTQGATWTLKPLNPGDGGRITVTGTLSGNQNESKAISVTLQRNINGNFVNYEQSSDSTMIASPVLNVNLSVNGSSTYVSHAGDTLNYTLDYKNTSKDTLTGLNLSVKLDGSMYDFTSVIPHNGYFDSGTGIISWNASAVPQFNNLGPNQSGEVSFSVRLKSSLTGSGSSSYFVHATATLSTDSVPSDISGNSVTSSDDVVTKITSQPTFGETLYYNDAAFGQTGPLPPVVGQETDFTVHWKVINPGNDLSGAKITAVLPTGVTWKNVLSVGSGQAQPTYNKASGVVTWNLGSVPAGTGVNGPAYELAFQVSVKPSSAQAGQEMVLVKSPTLVGGDAFTGQAFVVNATDLTTSNAVDRPNQGTVQSQ